MALSFGLIKWFVLSITTYSLIFIYLCLFLHFRGRKAYEPPRYMTINTAIEQLLEISQAREESGEYFDHSHHSRHEFHVWIMHFLIVVIVKYTCLKFDMYFTLFARNLLL